MAIDILLIDLTRRGRARLGLIWRDRVRELVAKVEAAHRGIGVVALTDDPWTFDAVRFDALGDGDPSAREGRAEGLPFGSGVCHRQRRGDPCGRNRGRMARLRALVLLEGFGGELVAELAQLRALVTAANEAGDARGAETVRRLMGRLRSAASLPASLGALERLRHLRDGPGRRRRAGRGLRD